MNVEEILAKLVSYPVLGGENNLELIQWIKEYIEEYGVETNLMYHEDKTKAGLHCRIGPAVDGGIILSGHTDVVPVEGQDWETDPFKLIDKGDGKLYGRGSCDMKGFLACCLHVLPELVKEPLAKPIYFAFSYDEEIGCLGAPDLIEDMKKCYEEKAKYAIIGEPSLLQVVNGQKGIFVIELHFNGSAGHSSRIKEEVSAVHEAARFIMWVETQMDILSKGQTNPIFDPPYTTMHVGKAKGGIAHNVIADQCTISLDIRNIPQDKMYSIISKINEYISNRKKELENRFSGFDIKIIENHPVVPPLFTEANEDVIQLGQKISGSTSLTGVSYAAEAGQFAEAGFQSIICGPGSIAQAHRANEFISKDQLYKGVDMLLNLISLARKGDHHFTYLS